jgi:hypothetical protein
MKNIILLLVLLGSFYFVAAQSFPDLQKQPKNDTLYTINQKHYINDSLTNPPVIIFGLVNGIEKIDDKYYLVGDSTNLVVIYNQVENDISENFSWCYKDFSHRMPTNAIQSRHLFISGEIRNPFLLYQKYATEVKNNDSILNEEKPYLSILKNFSEPIPFLLLNYV